MKKIHILNLVLIGAIVASICTEYYVNKENAKNYYTKTVVVTDIKGNGADAIVTGTDNNGHEWNFICEDAYEGDIYSCVMYTKETKEIKDDEIVSLKYEGVISDWIVRNIENIESTETGVLITFKDNTGYYWETGEENINESICTLDER